MRKSVLIGLALALIASPALAVNTPPLDLSHPLPGLPYSDADDSINACFSTGITIPPPQFDHPARNEQIVRVPCRQVRLICHDERANACAILPTKGLLKCQIIIPTQMTLAWEYDLTLRHERGHCNSGSTGHEGYLWAPGL